MNMDPSNNTARLIALGRAPISVAISCRNEALTVRTLRQDTVSEAYFDQQRARCIRKISSNTSQISNAVSRRNARERKRVKLVNLGFANLRDHVPAGSKTKKLSKVETLRSAISYIRQLQSILGGRGYDDLLSPMTNEGDDDNMLEDNSSASEETISFKDFVSVAAAGGGSLTSSENTLSPASSTEGSLVTSPYTRQDIGQDEPQLMDISSWFS